MKKSFLSTPLGYKMNRYTKIQLFRSFESEDTDIGERV